MIFSVVDRHIGLCEVSVDERCASCWLALLRDALCKRQVFCVFVQLVMQLQRYNKAEETEKFDSQKGYLFEYRSLTDAAGAGWLIVFF